MFKNSIDKIQQAAYFRYSIRLNSQDTAFIQQSIEQDYLIQTIDNKIKKLPLSFLSKGKTVLIFSVALYTCLAIALIIQSNQVLLQILTISFVKGFVYSYFIVYAICFGYYQYQRQKLSDKLMYIALAKINHALVVAKNI